MKNMAAKSNNHSQENLKLCDMPRYKADSSTFTMVIFGGAGDLSQRKLIPNLYQLFTNKDSIKNFSIVGLGLPEMSELQYRKLCRQAIKQFDPDNYHHDKCQSFLNHLYYLSGDLSENEVYRQIEPKIKSVNPSKKEEKTNVIFYLVLGREKARIVKTVLAGHNSQLPAARIVPGRGNLFFYLDHEAASLLDFPKK